MAFWLKSRWKIGATETSVAGLRGSPGRLPARLFARYLSGVKLVVTVSRTPELHGHTHIGSPQDL